MYTGRLQPAAEKKANDHSAASRKKPRAGGRRAADRTDRRARKTRNPGSSSVHGIMPSSSGGRWNHTGSAWSNGATKRRTLCLQKKETGKSGSAMLTAAYQGPATAAT